MQVTNLEDILIFQCQQCFEFPGNPKWCNNCQRIYCQRCNKGLRQSNCNCEFFSEIDPILHYIYNLLSIQCQICQEIFKLSLIKSHQRKCKKEFNKSNLSITLKCCYCRNEIILGQQCQINYCYICLQPFLKDERQIIFKEEQIQLFEKQTFKCGLCLIEGAYIKFINHQEICNYASVICDCELQLKRISFMKHLKLCLTTLLDKEKQNLNTQQSILNLKNIYIGQKRIIRGQQFQLYEQQIDLLKITQGFYTQDTSQLEQGDQ